MRTWMQSATMWKWSILPNKLKQVDFAMLTDSMGFTLVGAQKGLLNGNGTAEGAVEWLLEHQEDNGIDDPIEKVPKTLEGVLIAQSYKCNDCGKILSNMANLELHAKKTGHSDFEETTKLKRPLTAEEKEAKIQVIKSLLKAKRAEREDKEKVDNVEREKQRRFMEIEMAKTQEDRVLGGRMEVDNGQPAQGMRDISLDSIVMVSHLINT